MYSDPMLSPAVTAALIVALGALVFVVSLLFVGARREVRRALARKEDLKLALAEHSASLNDAIERAEQANRRVRDLERFDGLTGVANKIAFLESVEGEWRRGRREKTPLALVFVAVDRFDDFDRTYGSVKGDECLRRVAAVLSTGIFRAGDAVGRWSEEWFAVLLPRTEPEGAETVARRLAADLKSLAVPHAGSSSGETVSLSAGVAAAIPGKGSFDELLGAAEAALEEALESGTGRVVVSGRFPAAPEVPARV